MALEVDETWLKRYCKRVPQKHPPNLEGEKPKGSPKPSKYKNEPTVVDGIRFPSIHEAKRWSELQLMLRAGEILGVFRQHPFKLSGGVVYIADFVVLNKDQTWTVEDAKGFRTDEFKIKKKLMKSDHGLEIVEV